MNSNSPKDDKKGKRYSFADYLTWPEDERWEIIDGETFDMTLAPSRLHAEISGELFWGIKNFFRDKSCKVYHAPFDVRFPDKDTADEKVNNVVQPDITVICDHQKLDDSGCIGAPDLIIEILSPSTASKDHIRKRRLYETHGVKEYWLVDPTNRIVTCFSLEAGGFFGKSRVFGEEDTVPVELFSGLEIDFTKVFPAIPKIVRESPRKYLARKVNEPAKKSKAK